MKSQQDVGPISSSLPPPGPAEWGSTQEDFRGNDGLINDSVRWLEWPEFWAAASCDQHAKQAGESQVKVSNQKNTVMKSH